VNVAADAADTRYTTIPPQESWRLDPEAAYVHYFVGDAIKDGVFLDGNGTLLLGGYDDKDADFFYAMVTLTF